MLIGIILIALGLGALAYQGITYTSKETIIDIGSIEASADIEKTIPLPPIVGTLAIISGVALVIFGRKKS
jgi:uncharacterized membrane protein HdeD (DUF308 family)